MTVSEWRLFNELIGTYPLRKKCEFNFRFRLEERFIQGVNASGELVENVDFSILPRGRIQVSYFIQDWATLRVSNELMCTLDHQAFYFDQNRVYLGTELKLNKEVSLEVGYLLIHQ